jgi:hypothetical protein
MSPPMPRIPLGLPTLGRRDGGYDCSWMEGCFRGVVLQNDPPQAPLAVRGFMGVLMLGSLKGWLDIAPEVVLE